MQDTIIQARHLEKRFGDSFAVRDATFDVSRQRIFGFVGPSGSGKTTTVRMLTGYYAPTSGTVAVFGQAPAQFDKDTKARVGYMPQLFVLYPQLSVWENLSFAASVYGVGLRRRKRFEEALEFVELSGDTKKLARDISGGMQRRLSLAATLIHDPELIFLDEPTAAIDPVLRLKFWEHFRHLRDQGRTLFITTQYVSEAAYCDLVGVMREGKLMMIDTPHGLRYQAYGGDVVDLTTSRPISLAQRNEMASLPYVKELPQQTGASSLRLVVDEAKTDMQQLIEWCRLQAIEVKTIEEFFPPFDDVFVQLMQREDAHA